MWGRWQRPRIDCLDQVANAPDSSVDLTPVSEAPADAVKAGWFAWVSGQDVPLIWERVTPDDQSCDT